MYQGNRRRTEMARKRPTPEEHPSRTSVHYSIFAITVGLGLEVLDNFQATSIGIKQDGRLSFRESVM
jgi:hypothetical protein